MTNEIERILPKFEASAKARAERERRYEDERLDEFLNLPEEQREVAFALVKEVLAADRQRSLKPRDLAKLKLVIGCLIANAIVAMSRGPNCAVHYSRRRGTYTVTPPYNLGWLGYRNVRKVIDGLAGSGEIVSHVAEAAWNGRRVERSTYRLSEGFAEQLEQLGISPGAVIRIEGAPLILLSSDDRDQGLISYDPADAEIADQIRLLEAYNAQLASHQLALPVRCRSLPADLNSAGLYRRFKNSFEEHGRFYGGWWQNLSKEGRAAITIDGEPTVELDYSGLFPRLLYHLNGEDMVGDAYCVPEIRQAAEDEGLPWSDVRNAVKEVFASMLNSKKRTGFDWSDAFEGMPTSLTRLEIVEAIERRHQTIEHHFLKCEGLRLMNLDSQICASVLKRGLEYGVPVLPIHDSFIVKAQSHAWIERAMQQAWYEQMGYYPVIS